MTAAAPFSLPRGCLFDGAPAILGLLGDSPVGGIEITRPAAHALPYAGLVAALLARTGFRLDFGGRTPADAIDLIADRLIGRGTLAAERTAFAADVAQIARVMQQVVGGPPPIVSLRSYFAPGDLVWHLDRMSGTAAYRFVWGIGRPAGMALTPASNIDHGRYAAYMRREHALLGRLDTQVSVGQGTVESLWEHRPMQLAALRSGSFPFVIDPARLLVVATGCASIHRVDTPGRAGAYHRSSWGNRDAPGLQLVVTASADA